MSGQNTSTAVMARRGEAPDSLDYFPTPPWATRAFVEHVFRRALGLDPGELTVWEPAAGGGHMVRPLEEAFAAVAASDVADYGAGFEIFDFLSLGDRLGPAKPPFGEPDWIFTNPPFKDFNQWVQLSLATARRGVVLFGRLQMLESGGRFTDIWKRWQPHAMGAVCVERVPIIKGKVDGKASSATAYGWLVVDKQQTFVNPFPRATCAPVVFIPPCRAAMERPGDYEGKAT